MWVNNCSVNNIAFPHFPEDCAALPCLNVLSLFEPTSRYVTADTTKIIQPVSTFTRRVVELSNQIIMYTVIGVLSGSQSVATFLPVTDNLLADLFYGIFILNK